MTKANITEEQVIEYLKQAPDFFERNLDVLKILRIPHSSRGAVSLVERQLFLLREQNTTLEEKLHALVSIAQDNQRITDQLHALATALVKAQNVTDVLSISAHVLQEQFGVEFVSVRLFEPFQAEHLCQKLPDHLRKAHFISFMDERTAVCGELTQSQIKALFEKDSNKIQSSAMVPLGALEDFGIIGLGSSKPDRFTSDMGVFYLNQLGALISGSILKYLPE